MFQQIDIKYFSFIARNIDFHQCFYKLMLISSFSRIPCKLFALRLEVNLNENLQSVAKMHLKKSKRKETIYYVICTKIGIEENFIEIKV